MLRFGNRNHACIFTTAFIVAGAPAGSRNEAAAAPSPSCGPSVRCGDDFRPDGRKEERRRLSRLAACDVGRVGSRESCCLCAACLADIATSSAAFFL